MCVWNGPIQNYQTNRTIIKASCSRHPMWLGSLESELGPNASASARRDVVRAKYDAICFSTHNTTTAEGKASCRADRENGCYPTRFGRGCYSAMSDKVAADVVCKDTPFHQFSVCISKFYDECGGGNRNIPDADGCVWEPLMFYFGAAQYKTYRDAMEAGMGGPVTYGACYPKAMVDVALDANGTYDAKKADQWTRENNGNPANQTDFFLKRGNCSYARMAYARLEYTARCSAINTLTLPSPLDPYLNTIDYAATAACEAAGCVVSWVDGAIYRNQNFATPESYWTCRPDPFIMAAKYTYDVATDGKVALSGLLCASPRLQNDKEACVATTL